MQFRPSILAAAAFLFSGALAACASDPQTEARIAQKLSAQPSACYWMSNVDSHWEPMPWVETEAACFALDSCNGGLGQSGGGCYKWALGPNAPARPWRVKIAPETYDGDE